MQSEHIRDRISKFDNKLYLEFGGKNITDFTPLQSMQLKRLVIQNVSQKTMDAIQEMLPDVAVASSARVFH